MNRRFGKYLLISILSAGLVLIGCGEGNSNDISDSQSTQQSSNTSNSGSEEISRPAIQGEITTLEVSDLFSNRDKEIGYDETNCVLISLGDGEITCKDDTVKVEGNRVTITREGIYLVRGSISDGSIVVETDKQEKVQLVLEGATIQCATTAPLYVKSADKVFVTLAPNSENKIINTGDFVHIDENNIDAAIFSKDDITFNGLGSLQISSENGHGVACKNDLVFTSGTYKITAKNQGLSGQDCIAIANGSFEITAGKDGLHSSSETEGKGFIYIEDGDFQITAEDEIIQATNQLVIAGGSITGEGKDEGFEAKTIEIAGGTINIKAGDDGMNATDGSGGDFGFGKLGFGTTGDSNIFIRIAGGHTVVEAGGDGLDSNGGLYVTGGETYIFGPEKGANGSLDYTTAGTITGGVIVAAGTKGMAENFDSSSTQCSALVTFDNIQKAGEKLELTDSKGNVLISCTPTLTYNSVVVSCPEMKQGETYQLTAGTDNVSITMTSLIEGGGMGFGGPGGGMGDKKPNRGDFNPEDMPERPNRGDFDPEDMPERPDHGDFDPTNRPIPNDV